MEPGEGGHYGAAIYFWLNNLRAAVWWAKDHCGYGEHYGVIEAALDCKRTLHVEQVWEDDMLRKAVKKTWGDDAVPDDFTSRHWKSKAVGIVIKICQLFDIEIDSVHYTREGVGPFVHPVSAVALYDSSLISEIRLVRREDIPPSWEEYGDE